MLPGVRLHTGAPALVTPRDLVSEIAVTKNLVHFYLYVMTSMPVTVDVYTPSSA